MARVVVFAVVLACALAATVSGQQGFMDSNGQAHSCQSLNCDRRPGSCGTGDMPWGQGNYQGCVKCPHGWGMKPVVKGDPSLIGCVECTGEGIDNCSQCCLPNGSKFCGEAYSEYGCCDWCEMSGFDNPPTHGVCYPTGTSPPGGNSSPNYRLAAARAAGLQPNTSATAGK